MLLHRSVTFLCYLDMMVSNNWQHLFFHYFIKSFGANPTVLGDNMVQGVEPSFNQARYVFLPFEPFAGPEHLFFVLSFFLGGCGLGCVWVMLRTCSGLCSGNKQSWWGWGVLCGASKWTIIVYPPYYLLNSTPSPFFFFLLWLYLAVHKAKSWLCAQVLLLMVLGGGTMWVTEITLCVAVCEASALTSVLCC